MPAFCTSAKSIVKKISWDQHSPFLFFFYDSQTPQLWKGVRSLSRAICITSSPHPTFARRFHFKPFLHSSPPRAGQERYSCIHPLCGSVVYAGMLFYLDCEWPLGSNYRQEDEVVPLSQLWWLNLLSTPRPNGLWPYPVKVHQQLRWSRQHEEGTIT